MFKVHSIKNDSNIALIDFLKKGLSQIDEPHLLENYHPSYSSNKGNLFYVLGQGRFLNGNYYIIESNGQYIGSAGWNPYTNDTALALTRAYIIKDYRTEYLMAELLMPRILEESKEYPKLWITCNEYNKSIYNAFVKLSKNQTAGLFNPWPEIYRQFIPIGKKIVNYTEQYVAELRRE